MKAWAPMLDILMTSGMGFSLASTHNSTIDV
jgi:hypothetical protein